MVVKDKFELIYSKTGSIENIPNISRETLNKIKISDDNKKYLDILVSGFGNAKGKDDIVLKNLNKCAVVVAPSYPLPGFVTKSGIACVNTSVLTSTFVSDYSAADIYAMYFYTISLKSYIDKTPFRDDIRELVTDYIFATFMKLFGKKYGLIGSYQYLIPNLQGVLALYINAAFMGNNNSPNVIKNISNKYYTNLEELDLNFDLTKFSGLMKCLKKNNIIPITENVFATTILNVAGVSSIPLFEDLSRFFATICGSSISGNTVFSSYIKKVNPRSFEKLLYFAVNYARKGL